MTSQKHVEDAPALTNWDSADKALGEIRELEARIAEVEGAKNCALKIVQDRHDAKIQPLRDRVGLLAKGLQEFAEFHREDMGSARSKDLNHGRIGFRLGQPALKPLAKWTWDKVLAILRENRKMDFIRVEESVRRDAILSQVTSAEELKTLGCQRVQDDRFYYEIKREETVATAK